MHFLCGVVFYLLLAFHYLAGMSIVAEDCMPFLQFSQFNKHHQSIEGSSYL